MNICEAKATIESCLIFNLRPHFLIIEFEDDFFHIIISHPKYSNLNINSRVSEIFGLLYKDCPDIINEHTVIAQCFSPNEINEVLEFIL